MALRLQKGKFFSFLTFNDKYFSPALNPLNVSDCDLKWWFFKNTVKMSILPKAIPIQCNPYPKQSLFNAIPIKLLMVFFRELEQISSQFVWKYKKPRIAKVILRKKNGTGGINLPDLLTILQSYGHQDSMVLSQRQKYRSMEQNKKPRDKSMHPYGHLIFDKGGKDIQWKKRQPL